MLFVRSAAKWNYSPWQIWFGALSNWASLWRLIYSTGRKKRLQTWAFCQLFLCARWSVHLYLPRALSETHSSFLQHSSVQITHEFGAFLRCTLASRSCLKFLLSGTAVSDESGKILTESIVKKTWVTWMTARRSQLGAIVLIGFVPLYTAGYRSWEKIWHALQNLVNSYYEGCPLWASGKQIYYKINYFQKHEIIFTF
jgi:hypothetical protein